MKTKLILALVALAAAPVAAQSSAGAAPTAPSVADAVLLKRGHDLTEWLYAGQADSIIAYMTDDTRQKVGGKEGVLAMTGKIATEIGAEAEVVEEKMTRRKGNAQYWRQAKFDVFVQEPLVFRWVFDTTGKVIGAGISPLSQAPTE